ncbi:hypothetical protein C8Q76DRAFT_609578, partial [Earliella scabrosa]
DRVVRRWFTVVLRVFWALIEIAGYRIIRPDVLREVWPEEPVSDLTVKQIEVPLGSGRLRMPLDVVVSLYLVLAPKTDVESIQLSFRSDPPAEGVGKAILPPYHDGDLDNIRCRLSVLYAILHEARAFQYVVVPPSPPGGLRFPQYTPESEMLIDWFDEFQRTPGPLPYPPIGSSKVVHDLWRAKTPADYMVWKLRLIPGCQSEYRTDGLHLVIDAIGSQRAFSALNATTAADITFLDLSIWRLSASQIIDVVAAVDPDTVCAISLSNNLLITLDDIVTLIAALPNCRRFNLSGCPNLDPENENVRESMLEWLWMHPMWFRTVESILHPLFLSVIPPIPCHPAFTFHYLNYGSHPPETNLHLPFFTPSQVVQALIEVMPLAFAEHALGDSLPLWNTAPTVHFSASMPRPDSVRRSEAFGGDPFYISAPMLLYGALASGTRLPGDPWSERPIVGTPALYAGTGDDTTSETWGFHFDWDSKRRQHGELGLAGRNRWAFTRYVPRRTAESLRLHCDWVDELGLSGLFPGEEPEVIVAVPHDLRGFLRCMADEGRPLPCPNAVEKLEAILSSRDPGTGKLLCELIDPDDALFFLSQKRGTTSKEREEFLKKVFPVHRGGAPPSHFQEVAFHLKGRPVVKVYH